MEYLDEKINNSPFVMSLIMGSKGVYAEHLKAFLEKKWMQMTSTLMEAQRISI